MLSPCQNLPQTGYWKQRSLSDGLRWWCNGRLGTGVKQEIIYDEDKDADEEPEGLAQPMLDYRQYYPTVLPMRPPGHDVGEADGDLLEDSKPPDLAHLLVCQDAFSLNGMSSLFTSIVTWQALGHISYKDGIHKTCGCHAGG
jgi:hypothetical protein